MKTSNRQESFFDANYYCEHLIPKASFFRRHHVLNSPVGFRDPTGTGPVAGTICFASIPLLRDTLPALGYELAGKIFDGIWSGGDA